MKRPITGNCDGRPRIFINAHRDGQTASWARHPAAKPTFATSPGAALEAALQEIGGEAAVIIWNPGP